MTFAMMQQQRVLLAESVWRHAVKRLGTFTISELAAELRCSQAAAREHVKTLIEHDPPIVRQDGRLGRKPMFTYIKPDDVGDAARAQQRFGRPSADEVVVPLVARDNSNIAQTHINDVGWARKVVREAVDAGWKLVAPNGSSKARLTKGTRTVLIPNSPRDKDNARVALRQQLFGDPARFRRREAS